MNQDLGNGFDVVSYLMGKSSGGGGGGGGGGVTILSGTADPIASQGKNGQLYLKDVGNPMPGYAGLEYLEVTTAGPYIDTEVVNDSTAYFEVDAQYTSSPRDNHGLFGSMGPAKEFVVSAYGGVAYFEAGGNRGIFTSSDTARHKFAGRADGLYLDEELLTPSVNWSNTNGLTYYLFAFNYYQPPWIYKTANAKIFGCKLYNGEVLVRDFIPVMRLSDSELGMLDLVNSRFYHNAGGGEFIAGPVISGVSQAYAKVSDEWQNLIGTDISDIDLGSGGGGGGGVPLLTIEQWNALSTAQKQAYGLLAIQNANSGFNRGLLVYGADYMPIVPAEMAPIYSWNTSNNYINRYNFPYETLGLFPTAYCMAFMSQNGNSPVWDASSNLLPPIASGNQGNGNWAICYGAKANDDYASTISTGDNWNNSEIVCFCFSGDVLPVVKEVFYEQGQDGTYTFTYTPDETEKLLLVVMRGGQVPSSYTIIGLTQQSHVESSGGRFNDVYYGELTSMGELSISIPYAIGYNNNNGSLLVALLRVG